MQDLHGEIESLAVANREFTKQANVEKNLLISQNVELKKVLSETKLELDLLKSEVET